MTNNPMFSIVLCTFNNAEYIRTAINSVLQQTCNDWELIIIDDGSIDNTSEVLASFCSYSTINIVLKKVNEGKASCLNSALRIVKGRWLIELDADDWFHKTCLEKVKAKLAVISEEVDLIFGTYMEWKERSRDKKLFKGSIQRYVWRDSLNYLLNPVPLAPRIYNIQSLHEVNGWNTEDMYKGRLYEDVYMIYQLGKRKKIASLNDVIYHRRLRNNSVSKLTSRHYEDWKEWLVSQED
ncbi:glycosyltransferase family 2 protein [Sutcliffiella rhizosphaerae]|uniref:Hyaluronan synthase n=1 Tax=Sutcliffiella rhizosphaerae TaxID=2880967 RepID=A0ABM8YS41_9BACI|nr:glycosyltransferase family 2 protein [Sutcliffiella rhizosphaerae]CAG9622819.1 Hyaluronan synthase [Sutcliffiella rhizosphaerae]